MIAQAWSDSSLPAASRYCSMLLEEGGLRQLAQVHTNPETHPDVRRLVENILESLRRHRGHTGPPPPPPPPPHRGTRLALLSVKGKK